MPIEKITEEKIKGINMTIKGLSKKFPFIKGWEFISNYEKYTSNLYINLYVDFKEAAKFYNKEFNSYHEKEYNEKPETLKTSTLSVYIGNEKPNYRTKEWDDMIEYYSNEKRKINDNLNNLYQRLPEEFQVNWSTDLYPDSYYTIRIVIDDFKQVY
jgi:hypothetical protein